MAGDISPPGLKILVGVQAPFTPADAILKLLLFQIVGCDVKGGVYQNEKGVGKPLLGLLKPPFQLRELMSPGIGNGVAKDGGPHHLPFFPLFLHQLHRAAQEVIVVRLSLSAFDKLEKGDDVVWIALQLLPKEFHVALLLFLHQLLVHRHIAVMVDQRILKRQGPHICKRPRLMDGSGIANPCTHTQQPPGHEHTITLGEVIAVVIALSQSADIPVLAAVGGKEIDQIGDILVQPLVRIQRQKPGPGAAVHHGVPGGGKIVDPGEIEQNIRIFFRDLPASVIRSGVSHHQLAGDGFPQGLERF